MYTLEQAYKDIQQMLSRPINQMDFVEIQRWFRIYDPEYIEETLNDLRQRKGRIGNLVYIVKVLQGNLFDYEDRKKAIEAMKASAPSSNQIMNNLESEQEKKLYQEFLKWKEEQNQKKEQEQKKPRNHYEEGYIDPRSAWELLQLIDANDREANIRRVKEIIQWNKEKGYKPEDLL